MRLRKSRTATSRFRCSLREAKERTECYAERHRRPVRSVFYAWQGSSDGMKKRRVLMKMKRAYLI